MELRIRTKLFITYFTAFTLILIASWYLTYSLIRSGVDNHLSNHMNMSLDSIHGMIVSTANLSIENQLESIVDAQIRLFALNLDDAKQGYITEQTAKTRALAQLTTETIGTTGYLYSINSKGIIQAHPEPGLVGVDVSDYEFIKQMLKSKKGYLEYEWQDQKENHPRLKVLYMDWFKPWDLIVSASCYKDEFSGIVNLNDLSAMLSSFTFGGAGFAFIVDTVKGTNITPDFTASPHLDKYLMKSAPLARIGSTPRGITITQTAEDKQEPGPKNSRKVNRVIHAHMAIPEFGWTIVIAAYPAEFDNILSGIKQVFLMTALLSIALILVVTLWLSNGLQKPARKMIKKFELGSAGNFSVRLDTLGSTRELNLLAGHFNRFMETCEHYTKELGLKILELKKSEEKIKILAKFPDENPNPVLRISKDFCLVYMNQSAKDLVQGEIFFIGKKLPLEIIRTLEQKLDWLPGQKLDRHFTPNLGNIPPGFEITITGRIFFFSISRISDTQEFYLHGREITEIRKNEDKLKFNTYHDTLTGLPNRLLFEDRLDGAITASKKNNSIVAVICIDLDNFKHVNQSFGLHVGDQLLKEAGQKISGSFKEKTTVSRFGGDQFNIILKNLATPQAAGSCATRLMGLFKTPFVIQEKEIYVNISLGISLFPWDGTVGEILIKNAEIAMHRTKEAGKNSYSLFESGMNKKIEQRLELEAKLRQGLIKNEFKLFYQPKVSVKTGRITGMEALIRWYNDENGLVSPADFIPIAEETGIIVPMGTWVLTEACSQTRAWHELGFDNLKIAINLSAVQFRNKSLLGTIKTVLAKSGLAPDFLNLEITESLVMKDVDGAIATMNEIADLGVSFSMDDFGTGYSSLAYLKRFPVSTLKVDQSFVREIPTNKDDMAIARTIISMAKSLNMTTVAEGVETGEQLNFMQANNCDEIQGYLFSPPVPADQFLTILERESKEPE